MTLIRRQVLTDGVEEGSAVDDDGRDGTNKALITIKNVMRDDDADLIVGRRLVSRRLWC